MPPATLKYSGYIRMSQNIFGEQQTRWKYVTCNVTCDALNAEFISAPNNVCAVVTLKSPPKDGKDVPVFSVI